MKRLKLYEDFDFNEDDFDFEEYYDDKKYVIFGHEQYILMGLLEGGEIKLLKSSPSGELLGFIWEWLDYSGKNIKPMSKIRKNNIHDNNEKITSAGYTSYKFSLSEIKNQDFFDENMPIKFIANI